MTLITIEFTLLALGILIAGIQMYSVAKIKAMGKEQGKIKAQVSSLPDIQSIAEAQASGKSNIEFKYQKKKEDSDKLIELYSLINQVEFQAMRAHSNVMSLESGGDSLLPVGKGHAERAHYFINEANKLYEMDALFLLYFKNYKSDDFNNNYDTWKKSITNLYSSIDKLIKNIKFDEKGILTQPAELAKFITSYKSDVDIKANMTSFQNLRKNNIDIINKIHDY